MKTFIIILELIAIWLISLVCFAGYFSVHAALDIDTHSAGEMIVHLVFGIFIMVLYSIPFSFPAFLVFLVIGLIGFHLPMNKWIKKGILLFFNYLGVLATFFLLYAMSNIHNEYSILTFFTEKNYMGPVLSLIISSTLAIVLLPFPDIWAKKSQKA